MISWEEQVNILWYTKLSENLKKTEMVKCYNMENQIKNTDKVKGSHVHTIKCVQKRKPEIKIKIKW